MLSSEIPPKIVPGNLFRAAPEIPRQIQQWILQTFLQTVFENIFRIFFLN